MARDFDPFSSLSGATSPAAGTARDLEGVYRDLTMCVVTSGSPTNWSVSLEGSHDGVNWAGLASVGNSGTPLFVSVNTHLVRHIRANLNSLSGGSSPTVTATIATDSERT